MNIERLRAVKQKILDEPESFDMSDWECGTTRCIGGWACLLFPKEVDRYFSESASRILGLDHLQREKLFYQDEWPPEFRDPKIDPAKIAAARIEHFISTNGEE